MPDIGSVAISLLAPAAALAAEPKAVIQGDLDKGLRSEIERAVGVAKTHAESRVDARRRAREASEAAIAVLRSEGYYDYQVEADVGEGDMPDAVVKVTTGPRSTIGESQIAWDGAAPDAATIAAAEQALALKNGIPGRAADVVAAEATQPIIYNGRLCNAYNYPVSPQLSLSLLASHVPHFPASPHKCMAVRAQYPVVGPSKGLFFWRPTVLEAAPGRFHNSQEGFQS